MQIRERRFEKKVVYFKLVGTEEGRGVFKSVVGIYERDKLIIRLASKCSKYKNYFNPLSNSNFHFHTNPNKLIIIITKKMKKLVEVVLLLL